METHSFSRFLPHDTSANTFIISKYSLGRYCKFPFNQFIKFKFTEYQDFFPCQL